MNHSQKLFKTFIWYIHPWWCCKRFSLKLNFVNTHMNNNKMHSYNLNAWVISEIENIAEEKQIEIWIQCSHLLLDHILSLKYTNLGFNNKPDFSPAIQFINYNPDFLSWNLTKVKPLLPWTDLITIQKINDLLEDQSQYKVKNFEYTNSGKKRLNNIINEWEENGYFSNQGIIDSLRYMNLIIHYE